jgi:PII-like signaling protein
VDQDCVKLTTYLSDRHRIGGRSGSEAQPVLNNGGETAARILLRGTDGSGLMHQVLTGRPLIDNHDVQAAGADLVTLERGRLLSGTIDPVGLRNDAGEAIRLTIFCSREDLVYQVPAFEVICELLHRRGIAGATALAGVTGILHGSGQRAQFLGRGAATPMMAVAVSSEDRLGLILPELGGLLRRPLFTLEPVHICKRDGQFLAPPPPVPGVDDSGSQQWQQLTIYASASVRHDGEPVHQALVRRLQAAGATSATTVRGVWGFRGDRVPHGGNHHAPAITTVTAAPERVPAAFAIVDQLTAEHGLVTSNAVTGILTTTAAGSRRRHIRPR